MLRLGSLFGGTSRLESFSTTSGFRAAGGSFFKVCKALVLITLPLFAKKEKPHISGLSRGESVWRNKQAGILVDIHPAVNDGDSLPSRVGFLFHRDA